MESLTLEADEYSQLKRAFQGGFTHANAHHVGKVLDKVGSHDFTSSYPAVMVLEKFPMAKAEYISNGINESELMELLITRCCLFDIEIWGLMPKLFQEHPISRYKCPVCENAIVDNGRIVMAEHIITTITEQDFFVYTEFYTWDRIEIKNLRTYQKNYLPKNFVQSVLNLYEKKTVLKDVEGEEINYMISKNMINAAYGMMVTDPIRDELMYSDNTFYTIPKNIAEGIDKYNTNIRRFLFYPWGVWVTAYARYQLLSVVAKIDEKEDHVIYCDTDSIYMKDTPRNRKIIEEFNKKIYWQNAKLPECFNDIGAFDEIMMKGDKSKGGFMFKTLGAKRYVKYKNGKCEVTVAGMRKGSFEESISTDKKTEGCITIKVDGKEKYVDYNELFDKFDNDLMLNIDESHKNTHSYNDVPHSDVVTDEYGNTEEMSELSSVGIYEIPFKLTMEDLYIALLLEIKDEKRLSFSEIRTNREDYLHRRESEIRNKH